MPGAWTAITVYPERGQFRLVEFPAGSHAGPFVTLHLGEGVSLQVDKTATLDALAELVKSAQSWLATAGPTVEVGQPVGNTGLVLGPLPVGVA